MDIIQKIMKWFPRFGAATYIPPPSIVPPPPQKDDIERIHDELRFLFNLMTSSSEPSPWSRDIWTMTDDEYVAAIPDEQLRTRISGYLMRAGWEAHQRWIQHRINNTKD